MDNDNWKIWIDTGGTFTDCIATDPDGCTQRAKVLSTGCLRATLTEKIGPGLYRIEHRWPVSRDIFGGYEFSLIDGPTLGIVQGLDVSGGIIELDQSLDLEEDFPVEFEIRAGEEAPILAARIVTQTRLDSPLPPMDMRLGSTKGTNALLERKGAPVTLLITRGFADLTLIGAQQRPNLFQLDIPVPQPLFQRVLEVEERLDAEGQVIQSLEEDEVKRIIAALQAEPPAAVAVAFLHAYRNPLHELQIKDALAEAGIPFVSLSHALTPSIKILPRAQTAMVNAYLSPVIADYLRGIRQPLPETSGLRVMTSTGGLVSDRRYEPKDSLLSGPAGGVMGAARIARQMGCHRILTFDMGGTSTDTARYAGSPDYHFTTRIEQVEMASPCLAIETVAAGGGSVCYFDGEKLVVGPQSAGASPGPASYGAGGPLTITDVNLLLGKLDPQLMGIPVSTALAAEALQGLQREVERATGEPHPPAELLAGLERIANEKMAEAIRRISVAKGFDPKDYALLAFGGAGGLHACQLAELLQTDTVILPFDAGLLSAYGIGHAPVESMAERQILQSWREGREQLTGIVEALSAEVKEGLAREGIPGEAMEIREVLCYLRLAGQNSTLEIPYRDAEALPGQFEERYRELFGHYPEDRTIELESIKVFGASTTHALPESAPAPAPYAPQPLHYSAPSFGDQEEQPVYDWRSLQAGARIRGPAIIINDTATAFIAKGWRLTAQAGGHLLLQRPPASTGGAPQFRETIELELFTNRFAAIAEAMGAQLQRTAFSVNIKERLDFSCALLDPDARLLVNAPHIPVHLGSLGVCARLVREKLPLEPGDVLLTNHPRYGGSHLPDLTLLAPVYTPNDHLLGYVINRAHHAEIGGARPGSMPPDARNLAEEGVAFPPTYLARRGVFRWNAIRQTLEQAPYPTRAIEENIADINAALAALRRGERDLLALARQHGADRLHHYMKGLQQNAERILGEALEALEGQHFSAEEKLDDGHRIHLRGQVQKGVLELDFAGTSGVHPRNLNANQAIVYSAVIYVLRLLCRQPLPLNEGLLRRLRLHLPESFLHPAFEDEPERCPAVVGGNTEVSQRLVDTLIKALGLAACSQGTMNNLLFGNQRFGYYETIGGGAGAGPGFHGRSAVHQHMTNTRITDPEELEFRYPVRLNRFAIRAGSGGNGRWRGGDGIIRDVTFLETMDLTLLTQHRVVAPYGMKGGEDGACGRQYLIRADGERRELRGIDHARVEAGDRVVVETPGGGGYQDVARPPA